MNRIIIAAVAIMSAITISFVGFFAVKNTCTKLETELIELCETAQEKNTEKAIKKTDDLISLWEDIHGTIEAFVDHNETDKLEEIIKNLPIYAQQDNMERLEQQADLAIDEIHQIIRGEKPLISNIF